MSREIKFRAWHKKLKRMVYKISVRESISGWYDETGKHWEIKSDDIMQFTGLLDKNGLTDIYECDIIDKEGIVRGNKYENENLLKEKTNLLIQGFGTSSWQTTNKEAMDRGCKYTE